MYMGMSLGRAGGRADGRGFLLVTLKHLQSWTILRCTVAKECRLLFLTSLLRGGGSWPAVLSGNGCPWWLPGVGAGSRTSGAPKKRLVCSRTRTACQAKYSHLKLSFQRVRVLCLLSRFISSSRSLNALYLCCDICSNEFRHVFWSLLNASLV